MTPRAEPSGPVRVAEISTAAIRANVERIRGLAGGTRVIVVVKADGYGHGAATAARAAMAGGATMIATADLDEALRLRDAGIDAPLLCWLHGPSADFAPAIEGSIEVGVSGLAQLEALAAAARALGRPATIQFKVDTGLSRNGAPRAEWEALFVRGAELERAGLVRVRGIFSHLANAGREADLAQGARFEEALRLVRAAGSEPELIHLSASDAVFDRPELRFNAVRVGLAAYGLSPFPDRTSAALGLVPAMTLRSEIVALREAPVGTRVSYGYAHVCEEATTLALVPIGYADGMPRGLSGSGVCVTVAGEQRPVVGRIAMDQCVVDLGPLTGRAQPGEPVILFGDPARGHQPVERWAELLGTISYEIVVGIGARVARVEVDGGPVRGSAA